MLWGCTASPMLPAPPHSNLRPRDRPSHARRTPPSLGPAVGFRTPPRQHPGRMLARQRQAGAGWTAIRLRDGARHPGSGYAPADARHGERHRAAEDGGSISCFQVAGKVATVGPDEGKRGTCREVLAKLDPTDYQLAFEQLESQSDRAIQERDRYLPLLAAGSVSLNDMERHEALVRQSSAVSLVCSQAPRTIPVSRRR